MAATAVESESKKNTVLPRSKLLKRQPLLLLKSDDWIRTTTQKTHNSKTLNYRVEILVGESGGEVSKKRPREEHERE